MSSPSSTILRDPLEGLPVVYDDAFYDALALRLIEICGSADVALEMINSNDN